MDTYIDQYLNESRISSDSGVFLCTEQDLMYGM